MRTELEKLGMEIRKYMPIFSKLTYLSEVKLIKVMLYSISI